MHSVRHDFSDCILVFWQRQLHWTHETRAFSSNPLSNFVTNLWCCRPSSMNSIKVFFNSIQFHSFGHAMKNLIFHKSFYHENRIEKRIESKFIDELDVKIFYFCFFLHRSGGKWMLACCFILFVQQKINFNYQKFVFPFDMSHFSRTHFCSLLAFSFRFLFHSSRLIWPMYFSDLPYDQIAFGHDHFPFSSLLFSRQMQTHSSSVCRLSLLVFFFFILFFTCAFSFIGIAFWMHCHSLQQ